MQDSLDSMYESMPRCGVDLAWCRCKHWSSGIPARAGTYGPVYSATSAYAVQYPGAEVAPQPPRTGAQFRALN